MSAASRGFRVVRLKAFGLSDDMNGLGVFVAEKIAVGLQETQGTAFRVKRQRFGSLALGIQEYCELRLGVWVKIRSGLRF